MPAPQLDLASVLLKTYLFEDFSPAELEPLARAATLRTAVRGEYIFHVGDPADAIYVVASGQLKDSIATEDGDEVVYNLWGPRMVVGEPGFFAPERNRVMALVALEPTTLLVLRREDLLPFLARHPAPLMRLLEHLASVARASTEIILALARRPLADRLLLRLLDLAETSERAREAGAGGDPEGLASKPRRDGWLEQGEREPRARPARGRGNPSHRGGAVRDHRP